MTAQLMMFNEDIMIPEYSMYSGDTSYDTQPFRIDDGKYKGTIFLYNTIELIDNHGEGTLKYSVTILNLMIHGETKTEFDSELHIEEFHEVCAKPILIYIITNKQDGAIKDE